MHNYRRLDIAPGFASESEDFSSSCDVASRNIAATRRRNGWYIVATFRRLMGATMPLSSACRRA